MKLQCHENFFEAILSLGPHKPKSGNNYEPGKTTKFKITKFKITKI